MVRISAGWISVPICPPEMIPTRSHDDDETDNDDHEPYPVSCGAGRGDCALLAVCLKRDNG
jgi:hypothetical protein